MAFAVRKHIGKVSFFVRSDKNIISKGEKLRDRFITECNEDANRFEKPISKQVIHTFAAENKLKMKRSDGKIAEVKVERNIMGRLLVLSLKHKIDLLTVLSYPLTIVPLSLSHLDGSINKTDKSKLYKLLENRIPNSSIPTQIDCTIFDGFFFLHLLRDPPVTHGRLAIYIFKKLCRTSSKRIDLIFDKCVVPSLKDIERERRAGILGRDSVFKIIGEEQKRPNDFLKTLRSDSFKTEFVQFLVEHWKTSDPPGILGDKILRVNCGDICYMFYETGGHVNCTIDEVLYCSHNEADTRILFHIAKLPENTNVVIRASDTDILIIAVGNMHKLTNGVQIWMETGLQSKNTLRYVSVNDIYRNLGDIISQALPAYHALTGSDYTPSFARKGHQFFKSIDWDLLEQKQVPPPYKPRLDSDRDLANFPPEFTDEPVHLTPDDPRVIEKIDQSEFEGFEYVNPLLMSLEDCV